MPARWNDLFDRNLLDAIREFSRWQDATLIVEEDGVLLVSGGTEFPIGFSNCAARTDPHTDPAKVIELAEEFSSRRAAASRSGCASMSMLTSKRISSSAACDLAAKRHGCS